MKINVKNGILVQEKDIDFSCELNAGLPRCVCDEMVSKYGRYSKKTDENHMTYFNNEGTINFFNSLNYILDYDFVQMLSIDDLNELLRNLKSRQNHINEEYLLRMSRKRWANYDFNQGYIINYQISELKYYIKNKDVIDQMANTLKNEFNAPFEVLEEYNNGLMNKYVDRDNKDKKKIK